jgi:uncharacterized phage protein (TIGR02218 family)
VSYATLESSIDDGAPIELYRFTRGADSWTYTISDTEITWLGDVYAPIPITRDEPDYDQQKSGPLTITVPRDNDVALLYRVFVPASTTGITVYRAHRDDLADIIAYWQGRVRSVEWRGSMANIMCEPMDAMLKRQALRRSYGINCQHMLYDTRCTVNPESFRAVGTVGSVNGTSLSAGIFALHPNGWWVSGYVRVAQEDYRMVVAHSGSNVTLLSPFENLSPGDTIEAYAGCDRAGLTCRDKFSNAPNFGGFPWIPRDNPFQTGLAGKKAGDSSGTIAKTSKFGAKNIVGPV